MVSTKWIVWGVSGLALAGVAAQPYRPMVVVGRSMSPTYHDREVLWTAPVDRPLRRGDVVVADGPDGPVVKRVVLLPGDRRSQWHNLDGWLDMATYVPPRSARAAQRIRNCVVPAGTVFLLGDNLQTSIDSRSYGPVPLSRVRRLVIDPREPDIHEDTDLMVAQAWIAAAVRARRV